MTTPTNPLTYNDYVTQIGTMAVVKTQTTTGVVEGVDTAFNDILPQMLNYAELRIQRDLDLLPLQTNVSYTLTIGAYQLAIPTVDFVTVQTVAVSVGGATTPLLPVTNEYIQNVYQSGAALGVPVCFAMVGGDDATAGVTSNIILLGPAPDQSYAANIYGTIRAPSLYKFANPVDAGTEATFISTWLPDLLIMASMIYISAYQRNFGRMSDDPAMALSYEQQYQALLKGAVGEEFLKQFEGAAWGSNPTSPIATPSR